MPLKLANNAVSRLSASLSAASTTFDVMTGDGAKFPALSAGDWCPLTIIKADGTLEIVRATARSSDTFTVVRAQEGTTATDFSAGDRVELRMTKGAVNDIEQRVDKAVLSYPDYAAASAAAATMPDGQNIAIESDETRFGRRTLYVVHDGALVFDRMASDVASITEFGAKLDGTDDTAAINAASNAVKDFGGGVLKWPSGVYNFAFTKPPYGVIWDMDGPDITREQIGGLGSSVRFQKARLAYIDGPHPASQIQTEHIRTIAKGSGAIGAPYADYTMGLTIEKENWNKPDQVQAGEIDTLTIFLRAGGPALPAADGGISGGAGILGNVGMLEGSGMVQFIEATASVFDRSNPNVINRQVNTQVLGLNPRDGTYYGAVYNNILGSQNAAIRAYGTTANPWNRILENQKDGIVNFHITDEGQIRWRKTATVSLEQEAATNDLLFKTEAGVEMARLDVSQALFQAKTRTNVKNGASVTLTADDLGCIVSLFHTEGMTLVLPNNLPVGFHCKVLQRDAQSPVTFSPAAGAALRNVDGHTKTKGVHAICDLVVTANSSGTSAIWYLANNTAA